MKKIIFLTILILLVFACADSEKTDGKYQEFSFYYGKSGSYKIDLPNTTVGIMLMSKTGVKLNMKYTKNEDPATDATYMTAAEDYPDIIYGHSATLDFVSAGALIPLNDLIDKYGPNIKKHYGNLLNIFKDENGVLYYIGNNYQVDSNIYPEKGFRLPVKLLKEAGYPEVRRFNHYIELITGYVDRHKKENPGLLGFTALYKIPHRNTLLLGAAMLMGYPDMGDIYIPDMKNPGAHLLVQADFTRKYLKTLNRLWNEGYMDKETFSQNEETYYNKIANGKVIGFFDNRPLLLDVIHSLERRGLTNQIPVAFPVLFDGVMQDSYHMISVDGSKGVGISISCKNPEKIVTFWNRLLDEDIQRLIYWGVNKVHYYTNKKGKILKTPTQLRTLFREEEGLMRFVDGFPGWDQTGTFSDGSALVIVQEPYYIKAIIPSYLKNLFKNYGIESYQEWYSPVTKFPFARGDLLRIPEDNRISLLQHELNRLTDYHLQRVVTVSPEAFEIAWSEFQEALTTVDVRRYLDHKTAYYQKLNDLLRN